MASAALSCIALLTLVLLPVALYLAKRLRHRVGIAETHLSLCAAALPPVLVACYILGRPPLIRPRLYLVLLALVQSGGVSLAVLVLHRLCLRRVGTARSRSRSATPMKTPIPCWTAQVRPNLPTNLPTLPGRFRPAHRRRARQVSNLRPTA